MAPTITIRHADSPADLDAIRMLFQRYGLYLNEVIGTEMVTAPHCDMEIDSLPGRYAAPEGQLLLARVDGVAAGCGALHPLPEKQLLATDTNVCEMKRLFVLPEFRGLQLGRRLGEALSAYARAHRYEAMYLDTVPEALPQASVIYAALGFKAIPRYNDNRNPAVKHLRLTL